MVGRRLFFVTLGLIATGIAVAGVWLPGMPTVFPLIIALWAFSKSSVKLYGWVSGLPILKHALGEAERYERERTIDWRVKLIAMGSAWTSTIAVTFLLQNVIISLFVAGSALACTVFMLYTPTRRSMMISNEEGE